MCEKLRTLLESLLSTREYKNISDNTKENAIKLLTYCKGLLEKKKGIKKAKISTNTTSPSSDTKSTDLSTTLTAKERKKEKFLGLYNDLIEGNEVR